jgi:hypothetical protein
MATGGGESGGGSGGGSFAGDFDGVGRESDGGWRSWGGGDDWLSANADGAEQRRLLPGLPPPPPESQQAWTAGGRHSCNDPMNYYLYNGNG